MSTGPLRLVISGSSGFLGTHLVAAAERQGHHVTQLVRREAGPGESNWDPYKGELDQDVVEQADVVINLAGSPTLGNPHSAKWAENLRSSRITTTRVLAQAIATSQRKPAFLAGNGISFYGDHGAEPLTESSETSGDAFLTGVTRDWQAATQPAAEAGSRVCILRTAPILDRTNPPLKQQVLLFKAGLGGRLGKGDQFFPVISTRDWTDAVLFLAQSDVQGPVNLCCPRTPTNAEFTRELANQLHRPAAFRVPKFAIRTAAGRMASEALGSMNVLPQALLDAGFEFSDPDIQAVLTTGLSKD